jgi:hypothetical protein
MHADVNLIFSTLWAKISPAKQWPIQQSISDFQVISHDGQRFTPFHFNNFHEECLQFLKKELTRERSIVVTHHVPTFLNYPEKYKRDILNEAFAVELFDLIEASPADYWIYGHHHAAITGFHIGRTSLITNQLGYVKFNEHFGFNTCALVEI